MHTLRFTHTWHPERSPQKEIHPKMMLVWVPCECIGHRGNQRVPVKNCLAKRPGEWRQSLCAVRKRILGWMAGLVPKICNVGTCDCTPSVKFQLQWSLEALPKTRNERNGGGRFLRGPAKSWFYCWFLFESNRHKGFPEN